jgi:hypothetical protein
MRTIPLLGLILLTLIAMLTAAFAGETDADGHALGTTVEMPFLIAPVVDGDDLVANAFVSSRIVARSAAATLVVRDKLPFIQDAFVRDVNGQPIGKTNDLSQVDIAALKRRLEADAVRIVGRDHIESLQVINVQVAPLTGEHHK